MKGKFKKLVTLILCGMLTTCSFAIPIGTGVLSAEKVCAAGDVEINSENFPDDVFRKYVSMYIDTDKNGVLSEREINNCAKIRLHGSDQVEWSSCYMEYELEPIPEYCRENHCHTGDIRDLTGLRFLTGLTSLILDGAMDYANSIRDLDVAENTNLKYLKISLYSIGELICNSENISCVDINDNKFYHDEGVDDFYPIYDLKCIGIKPKAGRIDLISLNGTLDVTRIINLSGAQLDGTELTNITGDTITFDYILSRMGVGTETDVQIMKVTLVTEPVVDESGVEINEINFPDENFREYVSNKIDSDGDGKLSEGEIKRCTSIDLTRKEINDLTGVEHFTSLEVLHCRSNNLSNLDVGRNTELVELDCSGNNLSSLDVSKNVNLTTLNCYKNNLSSLDVSSNTALESLDCGYNNNLSSLDVSSNTELESVFCYGNNLSSLDVGSNTALKYLYCGENNLSSLDVSSNTALESLSCYGNNLSNLVVGSNKALKSLSCGENNLSSLDVSGATALESLGCYKNNLSSLDVSKNVALESLSCSGNNLSNLDVGSNKALKYLYCGGNNLSNLDVSKNVALESLSCSGNNLSSLDVSKNVNLTTLNCYKNNLSSLDVSKNVALEELDCECNNLSNLDVSKNVELMILYCGGNNLSSLDVSKNASLYSCRCNSQNKNVTVADGTIALSAIDPDLKASAISNLKDATLSGDKLTNITGDTVTYDYAIGLSNEKMDVTLNIEKKPIPVEGISLDKNTITLEPEQSEQLTATLSPEDVSITDVEWSVADPGIATVDNEGLVTAVKEGETTVTVTANDGGYKDSCKVTVAAKTIEASRITLDKKLLVLDKGKSGKLTAVVKPDNATDKSVTWSSSNTGVAKVDKNGNVTAVRHGTTKITAKTSNGKTATCEVRVNFIDVTNPSSWYYDAVYWAANKGIATGSNGKFQPAAECTREQAVTFLWRMAGKPNPKSMVSKFSDVKDKNRYSYKAVMWGTEKGLITGSKGKFYPGATCTREQIVTMIWRLAGKPEPKKTNSKFKDVTNPKSYSYKAIMWAQEKSIAKGSNGLFRPATNCKRRDIVTFIYRYKS